MKLRHLLMLLLFVVAGSSAFAQKENPAPGRNGPTSLDPGLPTREYAPAPRKKKKSSSRVYSPEQEFYERMMAVAKQRRKAARIMEKPQYSNPMYFGHKRPPKKHSAKKMRYCKECGIRH